MRSKNEIPNKFDFMKQHSFNFLLSEQNYSDGVHEKNVSTVTDKAGDSGKFIFLYKY